MSVLRFTSLALVSTLAAVTAAAAQPEYPSGPEIRKDGSAVVLEDYASLPLSSPTHGGGGDEIDFAGSRGLGRVNAMRSEPADAPMAASRFFVVDQSKIVYILEKSTRKFTSYLDFSKLFPKFVSDTGAYTVGLVGVSFHPEYAKNGKFYTVHVEKPEMPGSAVPVGASFAGYELTAAVTPPSPVPHNLDAVLVEWTDRDLRNASFEGSARELLRIAYNVSHPMGPADFNPLARPGDADYGNLYVGVGNGGYGDRQGPGQTLPQRLDSLWGKILRITPDLTRRPKDLLSANGRYRIPSTGSDPNPFVSVKDARPEVYAYGLRNPHRLSWDTQTKTMFANDIATSYWEEVNIITKGGNYGHPDREGHEELILQGRATTGSLITPRRAFPSKDFFSVEGLSDPVIPIYPVVLYSHLDGTAIGSGYVYRGKLMPQLRGKFVFTEISASRILYADLAEMLAAGGKHNRFAKIHEMQVLHKTTPDAAPQKVRMFDLVAEFWAKKGGKSTNGAVLPGNSNVTTQPKADPEGVAYGGGRGDIRIAVDPDGEFYVMSKADGMIPEDGFGEPAAFSSITRGAMIAEEKR